MWCFGVCVPPQHPWWLNTAWTAAAGSESPAHPSSHTLPTPQPPGKGYIHKQPHISPLIQTHFIKKHLVAFVGLVLKAEGQAKGRDVGLHESVSVLVLVQFWHSCVQLLHPSAQVLLGPLAAGQVKMKHLGYGLVVTQITALRGHAMRGWVKPAQYWNLII